MTTIYLETERGRPLEGDLLKLLRANTIAVLEELSIREDTQEEEFISFNRKFNSRKGQVVTFLSDLNWINSNPNKGTTQVISS